MDGVLDDRSEQLIDDLVNDPSLQRVWARYHPTSNSLKQNLSHSIHAKLADNIVEAISNKLVIYAPGKISTHPIVKPVTGFAIATSVVAMAILSLQQSSIEQVETASSQIAKQVTTPVTSGSQYVFPASAVSVESKQVKQYSKLAQIQE